jgi:hypothetical protein
MSVSNTLQSIHNALDGFTFQGEPIETYIRGAVDTTSAPPYIVIEIPDSQGRETLGRRARPILRVQIRVHDRDQGDGFYALRSSDIADDIHNTLKTADVTVNGKDIPFIEPDRTPLHYEAEGEHSVDINLQYDIYL